VNGVILRVIVATNEIHIDVIVVEIVRAIVVVIADVIVRAIEAVIVHATAVVIVRAIAIAVIVVEIVTVAAIVVEIVIVAETVTVTDDEVAIESRTSALDVIVAIAAPSPARDLQAMMPTEIKINMKSADRTRMGMGV